MKKFLNEGLQSSFQPWLQVLKGTLIDRPNRFLVRCRLQGKIIAVFVGTALACFAIQMTLQVIMLSLMSAELPTDREALTAHLLQTVLLSTGVGVLLLIPLSIFAGVLVTFRVAGPIYRLESYLEDLWFPTFAAARMGVRYRFHAG